MESRSKGRAIEHYTEAPESIDWPDLQPPPEQPAEDQDCISQTKDQRLDDSRRQMLLNLAWTKRRDAKKEGHDFLDWQRPPKHKIPEGAVVLGTGALVCNEVPKHPSSRVNEVDTKLVLTDGSQKPEI